jgi:cell division protein FtsN
VASFSESGVRALRLASATAAQAGAASGEAATLAPAAVPLGPASSAGAAGPSAPAAATGAEIGGGRALPGEAAQAGDAIVTPALPTETGARAGYGIQLGAFGSEASADREWQRLQVRFAPELGSLSPRIVPAESDSRQLYRLQVAASGEAQARALCDTLRGQAQACIPVVPR